MDISGDETKAVVEILQVVELMKCVKIKFTDQK